MATIVHFDVSARDPERAKAFYEKLFDWKITKLPGPTNYYMIDTFDLEDKPGIGGGISVRGEGSSGGLVNYVGVKSVDETIKQVLETGGTVLQSKQAIPGYGWLALCADTEKNVFGVFEENPA